MIRERGGTAGKGKKKEKVLMPGDGGSGGNFFFSLASPDVETDGDKTGGVDKERLKGKAMVVLEQAQRPL